MANTFKSYKTKNIGTAGAYVYTVPALTKSIVIGFNVANITGSSLPVEINLIKADATVVQLVGALRIDGGVTNDFLSGKKLVMEANEKLQVISPVNSSFDCVVSVLEGVD